MRKSRQSLFLSLILLTAAPSSLGQYVDPKNFNWGNAFIEGMERGRQQRMQEEQLRIQREQAAADRALQEEQRRAIQLDNEQRQLEIQRQKAESDSAPAVDPHTAGVMQKWMTNASMRSDLYPDFQQVVFAEDVASAYAADIAYFLGKNKDRSYAIAAMPRLQQAAALAEIEQFVRAERQY
jgi:hypothetical protein